MKETEEDIFIYDTYALIEILNQNPNYEHYTKQKAIINDFIFAEFCYNLIKDNVEDKYQYTSEVKPAIVKIEPEIIEEAMKFRYEHKKQKLSMTDCISYIMAKHLGIKFLTGDKEFEHMENVEFVK